MKTLSSMTDAELYAEGVEIFDTYYNDLGNDDDYEYGVIDIEWEMRRRYGRNKADALSAELEEISYKRWAKRHGIKA